MPDQDLVDNFADHLLQNAVRAWVYSIDKTLSSETWREIEACIDGAEISAFVASEKSRDEGGQHEYGVTLLEQEFHTQWYGGDLVKETQRGRSDE